MRLINADDIVYESIDSSNTCRHESYYGTGILAVRKEDIDVMPTIEPGIIRCKDCKHVRKWRSEESAKKFGQVYECARGVLNCPNPEDFCSKAERRTDG